MSEQSCGSCAWYIAHLHDDAGRCTWKTDDPRYRRPDGVVLLPKPTWGRYCPEWQKRQGAEVTCD